MRKFFYIFCSLLLATTLQANAQLLFATPKSAIDPKGYQAALDSVPNDWENDLWLNSHYKRLSVGEHFNIVATRVPQIIDNPIGNAVVNPAYKYAVIEGNSVTVDSIGKITATKIGNSVIKVWYDAITAYKKDYPAISPVNVTYVVVDVIDDDMDTDIELATDLKFRSYDTKYFTGDYGEYSFNVTAKNADSLIVNCNKVPAERDGSKFTVKLLNRANIIEIKAIQKSKGTETMYFVLDGRKIELNVNNATHPGKHLEAGDSAIVSFKGITLPVYKLATIYNPTMESKSWGSEAPKVHYTNEQLGKVSTNVDITQYDLSKHNSIKMALAKDDIYKFTDGHIYESWWGSPLGKDKDVSGPGEPNLNAPVLEDRFSFLPSFSIAVGYAPATFDDIFFEGSSLKANADNLKQGESISLKSKSGSFSFTSTSTNWGAFSSWYGLAVSNQTDTTTLTGGVGNQLNSAAGGDISGKGNYGVFFVSNSSGTETDSERESEIVVEDYPEGKVVQGAYVTNNTYLLNSVLYSDGFAKKFGGKDGNDKDFFKLTAKGFDSKDQQTGTVEFYLADYRPDNNVKDYVVRDWRWLDLSSLGKVKRVVFSLNSSDSGQWGMNTPAYFCIDNINEPRLYLAKNLEDITIGDVDAPKVIDLSETFADTNSTGNIAKSIVYNTNPEIAKVSIDGNKLTIAPVKGKAGKAEVEIKGSVEKMGAYSAFNITVNATSGVETVVAPTLTVLPNPATDHIAINQSGAVQIFAANGTSLYSNANYTANQSVDISNFAKGVYFVKVNGATQKLIVK